MNANGANARVTLRGNGDTEAVRAFIDEDLMKSLIAMMVGLLVLSSCATDGAKTVSTETDTGNGGVEARVESETEPGREGATSADAEALAGEQPGTEEGAVQEKGEAAAVASGTEKKEGPGSATGKPAAPVEVTCTPGEDTIRLEVRFLGAARNVEIEVWGTDGLTVQGEARRVKDGTFDRGGKATFEVAYSAPDDQRSFLGVRVSGRFGARELGTVRSCTVHPELPDRDDRDADIRVDENGEKIRIIRTE